MMYCVILLNLGFRVQQPKNAYQFKMKLAASKKMRRYTLSIYLINSLRGKNWTQIMKEKRKKGQHGGVVVIAVRRPRIQILTF